MGGAAERWNVLVVDDDADLRDQLCDVLEAEGFDVQAAADGLDALSAVDASAVVDAVVCDLDMPNLDGAGFVRRLRRGGSHSVVIMLSGHFDLLARAVDLGQVYALSKPVERDRLVHTLREALEGRD